MAYPSTIDSFPTRADGVDNIVAADHNSLASAIVAVEAELGTDPSSSFATVGARLNAIEAGALGASICRLATASTDTASGYRTMVGFDTTVRADTGYTATPGSGTIAVPSDGYYLAEVHARFSAIYTGGVAHITVSDGTNDISRGPGMQVSGGGIEDLSFTTITPFVTAGTALRPRIYTATSTSLVGEATGTRYYFRVVKL